MLLISTLSSSSHWDYEMTKPRLPDHTDLLIMNFTYACVIFYIKLLFHVGVKSIYLLNRARSETTDGYAASETASLLFSDTSTRESSPHKPIHMEMNGFKTSTPKANTIASMTGLRYNFT